MTDQSNVFIVQRKSDGVEAVVCRLETSEISGQPIQRCVFPEGMLLQNGDSFQGPYTASEAKRILTRLTDYPTDIHGFFGLTYAKWLVLPRVIMEQMPSEWQSEFVALLRQLHEKFDYNPDHLNLYVIARIGTVR